MRRIYVASSWRNEQQPEIVNLLRGAGHEVYDFRNPAPGDTGFAWSSIDPDWQNWSTEQFRDALEHPIARKGYLNDFRGMTWAECCVLVLPCGRSAHLEAGFMAGAGKPVYVLLADAEPELMYRLINPGQGRLCVDRAELLEALAGGA